MNNKQASNIPTSMATTKSKITVSTNEVTKTIISLLGAVLTKFTKVRHWHILYATINRIAAMVGIGIIPAYGIKTTNTMTNVMECTIPAIGVFPPFLILAAVLAIAPVAGIPPNKADAIFPAPCATSSISERCFPLIIPSATTQESNDSMAANTAMVSAFGSAF